MMSIAPHKIPLQEWINRLSVLFEKIKNSYNNDLKEDMLILHNDKYLPPIYNVTDDEFLTLCDKMKTYHNHIIDQIKKSGIRD